MPKTPQTQVIIGVVVFILGIGALSFSWILNVFAPAVIMVEQGPTRLEEHVADPLEKKDEKKMAVRSSSEDVEKPPPSEARSVANPLLHGASPTNNASPAPSTALHNKVQVEEQDLTLEEEGGILSVEEQYAQEQYLQSTARFDGSRGGGDGRRNSGKYPTGRVSTATVPRHPPRRIWEQQGVGCASRSASVAWSPEVNLS